jgi:ribosomal protein L37E
MSFMDPDQREAWAKRAEAQREQCRKNGGHTWGAHTGQCNVCGIASEESKKPRVTLVADDYRSVFYPTNGSIVIEKRSTDSLGADRWDVIDTLSNTQSRSEKSHHHIIALLSKGAKP